MRAPRQHSWENMRWFLIAIMALMLLDLASELALYGGPTPPSARTPAAMPRTDQVEEHWRKAVEAFRSGEFKRAQQALSEITRLNDVPPSKRSLQLRRVLAAQSRGDREAKQDGRVATIESPAAVWKQAGLSEPWLDRARLEVSAQALMNACETDRDDPAVRFGQLKLESAQQSAEWLDTAEVLFRLGLFGAFDPSLTTADSGSPNLATRNGDPLRVVAAEFEATSEAMPGQLFLARNDPDPAGEMRRGNAFDDQLSWPE